MARVLCGAGGYSGMMLSRSLFGYGLFTGGFGLHYGAERLGASVIPISAGNDKAADPDHAGFQEHRAGRAPHPYALKMADVMMDMGINPNGLSPALWSFRGLSPGQRRCVRRLMKGLWYSRNRQLWPFRGAWAGRCRRMR